MLRRAGELVPMGSQTLASAPCSDPEAAGSTQCGHHLPAGASSPSHASMARADLKAEPRTGLLGHPCPEKTVLTLETAKFIQRQRLHQADRRSQSEPRWWHWRPAWVANELTQSSFSKEELGTVLHTATWGVGRGL